MVKRMTRHLENLIPLSRRALSSALALAGESEEPVFAVDATVGNGHDTLFLAERAGERGRVWAFDVQEAAIVFARERFRRDAPDLLGRVVFAHAGHETAGEVLPPEAAGRVWAAVFNLGFLPGSDKRVKTAAPTTLRALESLAAVLAVGGVLSVHSYRGHDGGGEEDEAVRQWFEDRSWESWRVAEYFFGNKRRNREILYLAERISAAG